MFDSHVVIGHIGSIRATDKAVNVSVAVNRGENKTTWWEIAFWDKQKEHLEALSVQKGALIAVQAYNVYADAFAGKDGKPQAGIKATCHLFRLLDKKEAKEADSKQ